MNYSDFHLYTIASGARFIEAAERCADSFRMKCPGIRFTIFREPFPEYFSAGIIEKKPCANMLLYKYAEAPFRLPGGEKYIGQIDADCLCMCRLPLEYCIEDLQAGKFCASSDPKVEVNRREIDRVYPAIDWKLYFNSGVAFWPRALTPTLLGRYKDWVLDNIPTLAKIPYADQTWLNIWLNKDLRRNLLSEIGWYWNYRGTARHKRAYIWHAGGRDSEGIEILKAEYDSWR